MATPRTGVARSSYFDAYPERQKSASPSPQPATCITTPTLLPSAVPVPANLTAALAKVVKGKDEDRLAGAKSDKEGRKSHKKNNSSLSSLLADQREWESEMRDRPPRDGDRGNSASSTYLSQAIDLLPVPTPATRSPVSRLPLKYTSSSADAPAFAPVASTSRTLPNTTFLRSSSSAFVPSYQSSESTSSFIDSYYDIPPSPSHPSSRRSSSVPRSPKSPSTRHLRKSPSFASDVFPSPPRSPRSPAGSDAGSLLSEGRSPRQRSRTSTRSSERPISNAFPSLRSSSSYNSLAVPRSNDDFFSGPTPTQLEFDRDAGAFVPVNGTGAVSFTAMDGMVDLADQLVRVRSSDRLARAQVKRQTSHVELVPPDDGSQQSRVRELTASSASSDLSYGSSISYMSMTAGPTAAQASSGMERDVTLKPYDASSASRGTNGPDTAIPSAASLDSIIKAYKNERQHPVRSSSLASHLSNGGISSNPPLPSLVSRSSSVNTAMNHLTPSSSFGSSASLSGSELRQAVRTSPSPKNSTPIKSIDDIIREHAGAAFLTPRKAPAPPESTPAQVVAAAARGEISADESEHSRESMDSVTVESKLGLAKVETATTPKPVPFVGGFFGAGPGTPQDDKADARSIKSSISTPRSRQGSPAPGVDSDALSVERELATLLKSPRLTRLLTLQRGVNRGLTVSLADVGSATGHPIIVFLGLGMVRYLIALYDEIAEVFGLRLICIDRWGLGRTSDVADGQRGFVEWSSVLSEVVDLLSLDQFSILAHSAGSPYALAASLQAPERVKGSIHLLAPWVSTSADSLAGAYKYLKYVPTGVIRTAQAAEWKMQAWRLGKPPTIVHEPVGYNRKAGVSSSDLTSDADDYSDDRDVSPTSPTYPNGRLTVNGKPLKPKSSRGLLGGFFSGGSSSTGERSAKSSASSMTDATSLSRSTPPSMSRNSPTLGRRSSYTPLATPTRQSSCSDPVPLSPTTLTSPSTSSAVPSSLSGAELANGLMRASHAESLKGSTADLMVILERTSKATGFRYADVRTPVKVWQGDKDERISLASVRNLEKELLDCRVEIVEGADHSLMTNGPVMVQVLESIAADWK